MAKLATSRRAPFTLARPLLVKPSPPLSFAKNHGCWSQPSLTPNLPYWRGTPISASVGGGYLLVFSTIWTWGISDLWLWDMVSHGYVLKFKSLPNPPLYATKPTSLHQLVPVALEDWFYLNLFTASEPNGGARPILGLKVFNTQLWVQKFHIKLVWSIIALLLPFFPTSAVPNICSGQVAVSPPPSPPPPS